MTTRQDAVNRLGYGMVFGFFIAIGMAFEGVGGGWCAAAWAACILASALR